jgi:SAM-dependent methyltransferase
MRVKHLPYKIDPDDRFHFYENYWKTVSLELLSRHVEPRGKTLLDYGCGRGETLELAQRKGIQATGTDVDPECVRLASQLGRVVLLDVNDPVGQFGAKSFDIVTCFHVLEHVENPKRLLSDLAEISREYIVLAVPNLRYLHRLFTCRIDLSAVNEGHLQSWDHWHLRNLAERHCGLELLEWGFDATVLPLISNVSQRILGTKTTIRLETGLFRTLFPFHGVSIIGVFRVK